MSQTDSILSLLEEYATYRRRLNHSDRTIYEVQTVLKKLAAIDSEFYRLPKAQFSKFVNKHLTGSSGTFNWKLAGVKSFCKWLVSNEIITINPSLDISSAKVSQRLPKIVSEDIYNSLFIEYENTLVERRNTTIIAVFLATGMRISEVYSLNISDITKDRLKVIGKGDKERIVYLDKRAMRYIQRYLNERDRFNPKDNALFVTVHGDRIPIKTLRTIVQDRGANPHELRHYFATNLLRNGCNLEVIRQILGHSSIATTQKYLSLADTDVENEYRKVMVDE